MKVFLDTNILIDFISGRKPFVEDALVLFQLADDKVLDLMVSDLTIINTVYILRRLHYSMEDVYGTLNDIRPLLTITSIGSTVIDRCLHSQMPDFEDSVQYYSAQSAGADYIITRNKGDFPIDRVAVLTPKEFFNILNISL